MYPIDSPHAFDVSALTSLTNESLFPVKVAIAGSAYAVTANAGQNVHKFVCQVVRSCGFIASKRFAPTTLRLKNSDASKMNALHAMDMK
jgi:hypothetical protein